MACCMREKKRAVYTHLKRGNCGQVLMFENDFLKNMGATSPLYSVKVL